MDGGTNDSSNPTSYTEGIGVKSFAPASKSGFNFQKWTDADGQTITGISSTETKNFALYAVFTEIKKHKISYSYDSDKVTPFISNSGLSPKEYEEGAGATLPSTSTLTFIPKAGYKVLGWYDADTKSIISSIPSSATKDYNLELKIQGIIYTIRLISAAGGNPTDISVEYGSGMTPNVGQAWIINGTSYTAGSDDISRLTTTEGDVITATISN